MGARAYNSSTGRFSQVDPVPGGSANAYDYALQNPITNTDPTGKTVYQYCVNATRFFRTCAAVYDHFSTLVYIWGLEYLADWYQSLSDFYGSLPWNWASALSYYYQWRSIEYAQKAHATKVILSACGGEENERSGLYVVTAEARGGWWFFGWHYTGWYTLWSSPVWCHD